MTARVARRARKTGKAVAPSTRAGVHTQGRTRPASKTAVAAKRAARSAAAPAGTQRPKASSATRKRAATSEAGVTFFPAAADWRAWLIEFHAIETEFWVGFHKRHTTRPSITWPESVDGALCFGWIDGVRKRIDDHTYKIRFTPRKPGSIWSAVNVRRVQELRAAGLMHPAGEAAFAKRTDGKIGIYSYEKRPAGLPEPFLGRLKKNAAAFRFFTGQAPWYRRAATWWVISAKKDETREKRFAQLVADSERGQRIAPLRPNP